MPETKRILLVGTFDTKGHEYDYLRQLIERRGHRTLLMDAAIYEAKAVSSAPALKADFGAEQVALAGGSDLATLRERGDRNDALLVMTRGCVALARQAFAEGRFDAVLALG